MGCNDQPPMVYNAPSLTIEANDGVPVRVKWINELTDASGNRLPHLLPVDRPCTGPTRRSGTGTATPGRPSPRRPCPRPVRFRWSRMCTVPWALATRATAMPRLGTRRVIQHSGAVCEAGHLVDLLRQTRLCRLRRDLGCGFRHLHVPERRPRVQGLVPRPHAWDDAAERLRWAGLGCRGSTWSAAARKAIRRSRTRARGKRPTCRGRPPTRSTSSPPTRPATRSRSPSRTAPLTAMARCAIRIPVSSSTASRALRAKLIKSPGPAIAAVYARVTARGPTMKQQTLAMAADQGAGFEQYRRAHQARGVSGDDERDRAVGGAVRGDRAALPQGRQRPPARSGWSACCACTSLQHWFNLADEAVRGGAATTAPACAASWASTWARERVPDGTTLLKFRRLLEKHELGEQLFAKVGQVLQASGLKVGTGTIVDATHHRRAQLDQERRQGSATPRCTRRARASSGTSA